MKPRAFKSAADFRQWLRTEHTRCDVLWMRIFKKASGEPSITYSEALDQALCFGWIDGQKKPYDKRSWLQKFTPRTKKSGWSKTNTRHVARLLQAGLMEPAGLKAVEQAEADGRWQAAYDSPRNAAPPQDFLDALSKNRKARLLFESLNKTNIYSIVYRLQTAKKPETRARRMKTIVEMLERGETFHPQKR